jgi:hypothetical protein
MVKRKIIGIYLILCSAFLCPLLSSAQNNEITENAGGNGSQNETFYKYDIQAGGEITYPITNTDMVKTFGGIYSVNAAFDFSILKRLYVGVGVWDNEFAIAAQPLYNSINPRMFDYIGGLRIGYHSSNDKSNDLLFNATFTGGESHITFTNAVAPAPKDGFAQNKPYGSIYLMECYRLNEQCWIGLDVSFAYLDYSFDPDYIGIQNSGLTYYPQDARGNTTYIGWGFQIFYTFSKGKN